MAPDCDVMILCAGLGTRLRPLTLECAKPAVPLLNRPLVGHTLALVRALGLPRATINTHWLPETMETAARHEATALGLELHASHEPTILGTGGGLRQARDRGLLARDRSVLVLNGDVLFDVDLARLVEIHHRAGAAATMVLRPMPAGATYSPVEADDDGRIHRIGRFGRPGLGKAQLFSGIHLLSPAALDLLPAGESGVIETVYATLLASGARVQSVFEPGLWLDLGDPAGYLDAHLALLEGRWELGALARSGALCASPYPIDPEAQLSPGVRLTRTTVGARARIGAGAVLVDCVIWPEAIVAPGERLTRTIVTPRVRVPVP